MSVKQSSTGSLPGRKKGWQDFVQELRLQEWKSKLGPDLNKPEPRGFGLDPERLSIAEIAYAENRKIEAINKILSQRRKKFEMYIPIIGPFTSNLIFRDKKLNPIGISYLRYIEAENIYKEVLDYLESEKLLDAKRKEAEYWFSLGGFEFEEEASNLFQKTGYFTDVVKTKGTGDGGIDLILTFHDGTKILVQCKAHKSPVGPHIARDLYGAMQSAGINKGILISLGGVTQGVRDFIKGKDISIVDVNGIIKLQKMLD